MSVQVNPYAPPAARVADISEASSEAESIRKEHIKHEASVRSVGILYYIGGVIMLSGGIVMLAAAFVGQPEQPVLGIALGALYLILAGLSLAAGRGIRQLKPWARTMCIVLSAIGLVGFPIGTLINGYILYLMLAARGKRLFQPDYPAIVEATPDVRYRTSMLVWILLAIVVAGITAGIVIPLVGQ